MRTKNPVSDRLGDFNGTGTKQILLKLWFSFNQQAGVLGGRTEVQLTLRVGFSWGFVIWGLASFSSPGN